MQNLQRESKTPYGNQRKITSVAGWSLSATFPSAQRLTAIRGKSQTVLPQIHPRPKSRAQRLTAIRGKSRRAKSLKEREPQTSAQRLTAIRGKSHETSTRAKKSYRRAQRLTAIRGKSLSYPQECLSLWPCSTPYGNQRKITW